MRPAQRRPALIALAFLLVLGAAWAWPSRDSGDDKQAAAHAEVALAQWRELLARATQGPVTDAELAAANVEPGGPHIRRLVDNFTRMRSHVAGGDVDVGYTIRSTKVGSDGTVRVHAWLIYEYLWGERPDQFSNGSEGRELVFRPDATGRLRLVQDISDGRGVGGLTGSLRSDDRG